MQQPTDDISRLYRELEALNSKQASNPGDEEVATEIQRLSEKLRELQTNEAVKMEARLRESLESPLGDGDQILQHAEDLIQQLEGERPAANRRIASPPPIKRYRG